MQSCCASEFSTMLTAVYPANTIPAVHLALLLLQYVAKRFLYVLLVPTVLTASPAVSALRRTEPPTVVTPRRTAAVMNRLLLRPLIDSPFPIRLKEDAFGERRLNP